MEFLLTKIEKKKHIMAYGIIINLKFLRNDMCQNEGENDMG